MSQPLLIDTKGPLQGRSHYILNLFLTLNLLLEQVKIIAE